ncbi:thioredoxin domain-containing protein [soil metagenome]
MEKEGTPNRLIHESSPYLLQHAYNPVDWYPWGEEALQRAQTENKPLLVSIGYAACHWCHVMEHQSFEHPQIAELMNRHFVCIKVDREERPDVDQIYLDAVQAMGIRGGWPLHVFLNPQGKPFYGGTYFPPQQWAGLLTNIANAFQDHRDQLEESAEQFAEVLNQSVLEKFNLKKSEGDRSLSDFHQLYKHFSKRFDTKRGGMLPAPKFPMPVNYFFLLRYFALTGDQTALDQTTLTLREMAYGGLYDQAGGGFARYSVDEEWLVPHFEKMLYDNGQLLSLYAEAFQVTQEPLFKEVVYETVSFVERELLSKEGGFYSSLDADSEGEEGKFYVFTQEEINELMGDEAGLFSEYYTTMGGEGNWEDGKNILHRAIGDLAFIEKHHLTERSLLERRQSWKQKILAAREKRVRPVLDDKILASWNALTLKGLADAYRAFGEDRFLQLAQINAHFLLEKMKNGPRLFHNYKNGKGTIEGFLEDYAHLIRALISLYEVTFEEKWLREARRLTDHAIHNFLDPEEQLFFFTSNEGEKLIARKKEVFDNVIPASNSVMAINLHLLGLFFDREEYTGLSESMLRQVQDLVVKEPAHLANWAILYSMKLKPTAEIAVVGPDAEEFRRQFGHHFLPNTILLGTTTDSTLPILEDKVTQNGSTIFVCFNKTCQMPVRSVSEALDQMKAY